MQYVKIILSVLIKDILFIVLVVRSEKQAKWFMITNDTGRVIFVCDFACPMTFYVFAIR